MKYHRHHHDTTTIHDFSLSIAFALALCVSAINCVKQSSQVVNGLVWFVILVLLLKIIISHTLRTVQYSTVQYSAVLCALSESEHTQRNKYYLRDVKFLVLVVLFLLFIIHFG